jgi:hypothetical protein
VACANRGLNYSGSRETPAKRGLPEDKANQDAIIAHLAQPFPATTQLCWWLYYIGAATGYSLQTRPYLIRHICEAPAGISEDDYI